MKYIIVTEMELPVAIIFDELLKHDAVAGSRVVAGAGFCNLDGDVWGGSVSLGISSQPQDAETVQASMERRT